MATNKPATNVVYKVWIEVEVERINEAQNVYYEDVDLDFGSVGEFKTEEEAVRFAKQLQRAGADLR